MNRFREQVITWAMGLAFGGALIGAPIGACWVAGTLSDLIIG